MDFRSRGTTPHPAQPVVQQATVPSSVPSSGSRKYADKSAKGMGTWLHLCLVALLFSITALLLAVTGLLYFGSSNIAHAIQKDKYQAVFLNNGQVYFGHIKDLSNNRVNLQNIYYLQTSSTGTDAATAANSSVSLVKLGCELHAPYDQMFINNDQVIFWENLQDSGQVAKAIAQYIQQNPNGQQCSEQSQSSTNQAPATTTQPPTPTTPTKP